jgi:hypothetical protein
MMMEWCLSQAAECSQLAADATDPMKRSDLETEARLWLQTAAISAAGRRVVAQHQTSENPIQERNVRPPWWAAFNR